MRREVTGNPGRDPYKVRGDDLYETPPQAIEALLHWENTLPARIWEPAAGRGSIANVLRRWGHTVYASDLVDYGVKGQHSGEDFLLAYGPPIGCSCIVTNPPYKLATKFARHAITLVPKVYMLMRLAFLEGTTRDDVLEKLTRVYVFKNRLPRMHRDGWDGPKATSTMAFAWFAWDRDDERNTYSQGIELRRIKWE